ncbi:hypothetical protein BA939_02240 [Rhizobium sp. S41]|nr:hypothetical protein BA939_02240 [Rhizobium sp. S41]KGE80927.1 hypothetical protein LW14_19970 [Rhizobium sp. H41]
MSVVGKRKQAHRGKQKGLFGALQSVSSGIINAAIYHRRFDAPKAGIDWQDSVQNFLEVLHQ